MFTHFDIICFGYISSKSNYQSQRSRSNSNLTKMGLCREFVVEMQTAFLSGWRLSVDVAERPCRYGQEWLSKETYYTPKTGKSYSIIFLPKFRFCIIYSGDSQGGGYSGARYEITSSEEKCRFIRLFIFVNVIL